MRKRTYLATILVLMLLLSAYSIFADPNNPTSITNLGSESRGFTGDGGVSVQAQAGNITALNIEATSVTESWQGYHGNITGTIVLDNAVNESLYEWSIASPNGEVFASNTSSVNWSSIQCANLSGTGNATDNINQTQINNHFNIPLTASDRVELTFNESFAGSFAVGTTTINSASDCSMSLLFDNNGHSSNWQEVILTDSQRSIIFTALVANDVTGFTGSSTDFQLLVGEDGHSGDTNPSTYFFYVEIS